MQLSEYQQPTRSGQRTPAAAPPLDLDARLAAVDAAMTVRLETALLAFDIDSAHIEQPLDLVDVVRVPIAIPTVPEPEYATPIAALLQRAKRRLETGGWCTGTLVGPNGERCLLGAIRAEAPHRGMEGSAAAVVLDAIRRQFAHVETVPQFNDQIADRESALRILGEAADLANTRNQTR